MGLRQCWTVEQVCTLSDGILDRFHEETKTFLDFPALPPAVSLAGLPSGFHNKDVSLKQVEELIGRWAFSLQALICNRAAQYMAA